MEVLYHQTNRLLQEVTSQDLNRLQRVHSQEDSGEAQIIVVQKLDAIHA